MKTRTLTYFSPEELPNLKIVGGAAEILQEELRTSQAGIPAHFGFRVVGVTLISPVGACVTKKHIDDEKPAFYVRMKNAGYVARTINLPALNCMIACDIPFFGVYGGLNDFRLFVGGVGEMIVPEDSEHNLIVEIMVEAE